MYMLRNITGYMLRNITGHMVIIDDDSFVESSEEINDYVLNCQGVIWRGNYRQKLAMYWDYGQVESKKISVF